MTESTSSQSELTEGDGKTTGTQVPDSFDSGTTGGGRYGIVPKTPRAVETFGSTFEDRTKKNPFVEMLTSRIKQRQQQGQEKQSMEITPPMMRAFQNELGHLQMEKEAFIGKALGALGKGLVGAARGGAKGGLSRRAAGGALGLARKAGLKGGRAYQAVGGAALGAGALGAAGVGAAAAR